jgi:sulfur-oxidizing protein SoxX
MNTRQLLPIVLAGTLLLSACDREARMASTGFRLPDGDPQAGHDAFIYMQCHQCHTIEGLELPTIPGQEPPYVELGGDVTAVKTYGQLLTAIIYPSHKLANGYAEEVVSENGESNMYVYNEHMTVQELIDIVMFLQPQYNVVMPEVNYRR